MERVPACPRCGAAIAGDFKFCPACAMRLRSDPADEEPVRAPSAWKRLALVLVVAVVVSVLTVVGVLLFHPGWLERRPADTTTGLTSDDASRPFDVEQIRDDLVTIEPGFAFSVSVESLDEVDRDAVIARAPDKSELRALIRYRLQILRYEVTSGQYDEFLRDVFDHSERLPKQWRDEMAAEAQSKEPPADRSVESFILRRHVPEPWAVKEENGARRVLRWSLPDANRNLPITHVSFNEAYAFCQWTSVRLGIEVRLPVRMEWVHAARGGIEDYRYRWPWGKERLVYACNNLGSFGRIQKVFQQYTEPVGVGGRSPHGLVAMAGNVAEYAHDSEYVHEFLSGPDREPIVQWRALPESNRTFTICGGSFRVGIDDCQVESFQGSDNAGDASRDDVGFRVVHIPRDE